ncbi:MAG: RDD family protein [Planctomycetota bacterium]
MSAPSWRHWLAWGALCIAASSAIASVWPDVGRLPSVGGWSDGEALEGPRSHAWFVAPLFDPRPEPTADDERVGAIVRRWALVHVPPREDAERDGVGAGGVRIVMAFPERPRALACHGRELHVLFGPLDSEAEGPWRVGSLSARPGPTPTLWLCDPPMDTRSLMPPPEGRFVGFAATPTGPVLLLETNGETQLHAHARGRWSPVALPSGSERPTSALGSRDGLVLLNATRGIAWAARIDPPKRADRSFGAEDADNGAELIGGGRSVLRPAGAADPTPIEPVWRAFAITPLADPVPEGQRWTWWSGDRSGDAQDGALMVAEREGDGPIEFMEVSASGVEPRASLELSAPWLALAPHPDGPRVLAAWPRPISIEAWSSMSVQRRAQLGSPRGYEVAELSLATGESLYRGAAVVATPLSASEFRVLAVFLLGVMGLVLVFALRRDPADGVVVLPDGVALADPMRRAIASLIDGALAISITAVATGDTMSRLINPEAWVTGAHAIWVLPMILAVGLFLGTLSECLLGRTIGKLAMGCETISIRPTPTPRNADAEGEPPRPTLAQAFVRNAFKWLVTPGVMLAFVTPGYRHRGDVVSGVVVVRPIAVDPD